jgi:O-antigen/teichoic acid export membrane protein
MTDSPSTMRRDISTAYLVTAARIGAWLLVSALVYRRLGAAAFALLTLVRSTVGLLSYTSLGLAPAMIAKLAQAMGQSSLAPDGKSPDPRRVIYSNGLALVLALAALGSILGTMYAHWYPVLHRIPSGFSNHEARLMVYFMGFGVIARIISDVPAAVLQTHRHIALDNVFLAASEALWVVFSTASLLMGQSIAWVGIAFFLANAALLLARLPMGAALAGKPDFSLLNRNLVRGMLAFGCFVAAAELADFLYAPTDYIIINRLLRPVDVAIYAPAVQIDGALLLMVLAVADVLLPKTALAHHAGRRDAVRRYYLWGTLATALLIAGAAVGAYFLSPLIFRYWLGLRHKEMLPIRAILKLVLIHTVIGGSSAVGRSILLGMNKVRAFTYAVLIAAGVNVILSYCFVRYAHLGLRGVVWGTIVAVVGRCGIWMPWYVLRTLKQADAANVEFAPLPTAGAPF